jgi:hypothetical protein
MSEGMPRRIIDEYRREINLEEEAKLARQHEQARSGIETDTAESPMETIDLATAHSDEVPANRWGSREAEISSIQFLDEENKPKHVFETGSPFTIEIGFQAHEKIEKPVFGIGLYLQNGTCCYGTNTDIEGLEIEEISGDGKVFFHIDSILLIEGKYYLDVAIHKVDGYPYDYHTRCYSFAVRSPIKDIGIYRPGHHWQLDEHIQYRHRSKNEDTNPRQAVDPGN